jgi:putative ABC transport system substrate-binding protein
MASYIARRKFLATLLGGAAATWPLAARPQQQAMPVVGFLRPSPAAGSEHIVTALRRGLNELGYVEGDNVAIDYHFAENQQLPDLAADLVRRRVAVIVASGGIAAIAAKGATSAIPIVFVTATDPVEDKLVASLNRPGSNATGMTYLTSALAAKRVELMHELIPAIKSVAALVEPANRATEPFMRDLRAGAERLGSQVLVAHVTSERDLDRAFATLAQDRPGALIVGPDPLFTSLRAQIVAFAARHALPAIYTSREYTQAGGLMSWGVSQSEQYRLAGEYVGKILKGAKPADLPVLQPTKYELVINLKTAKTLGLQIPDRLLALADEVIE